MTNPVIRTTRSDGKVWQGFHPTAYGLNRELLMQLPIEVNSVEVGAETSITTIGRIQLSKEDLLEIYLEREGSAWNLKVETGSGVIRYSGLPFNIRLLETYLRFLKAGAGSMMFAAFFPYDTSSYMDTEDLYEFFIVSGNRIVELDERIWFSDSKDNGFNPYVFQEPNLWTKIIWCRNGGDGFWEAWCALWYRKFYSETRPGQLMTLRPDQPTLHFYPEGRWSWEEPIVYRTLLTEVRKARNLLLALTLIALAILAVLLSK